jgi:hypothetical protein
VKLNLAISGLLVALLVGCSETTTVAPTASPSATPSPTTTPVVPEKTSGGAKYTPKSLGLSEAKFKEISQLQGLPYGRKNESGKADPSKKFRIALPTYIPDGFIAKVEVPKEADPRYSIVYKNQNNQCFSFKGFISRGSHHSLIETFQPFDVNSIGLGKTSVYYVKYDRSSDKKRMETSFRINGQSYKFQSSEETSCDPISQREATKVIKSIDYVF